MGTDSHGTRLSYDRSAVSVVKKSEKCSKPIENVSAVKADFEIAQQLYIYFNNLVISNIKKQGKMYKLLNSLMNKKKDNPLPTPDYSTDLANIFSHLIVPGQNCEIPRFI